MQTTQSIAFENECCSLEHDNEANCLILNWKGLLPSKAFREVHQHALFLIRKHKISRIMADARRMKTIGSADAGWINDFWMPSAIAAGFRYSAIVESDYIFNQLSVNGIVEKVDPECVQFRYFKDREQALGWLRTC